MSGSKVMLPTENEMRERLKRTELSPQVTDWLLTELAPNAGDALEPEGVSQRLSLIINLQEEGPDPRVRLLVWKLVGAIIDALIDDPGAQKRAMEHVAKINRGMES